jgi:hypothetical protein
LTHLRVVLGALLVVCAVAAGCSTDDTGGDDRSDPGPPPESPGSPESTPAPSPDPNCPSTKPRRVDVPVEFRWMVVVCESEDGRSGTIENLTKAVLAVRRVPATAPVVFLPATSSPSLGYDLAGKVTTLGRDPLDRDRYLLGPKAKVLAMANAKDGPQLTIELDPTASGSAIAAGVVADYLGGFVKRPGPSLVDAGAACISGMSSVARNLSGRLEDLANALLDSLSCRSLQRQLVEAIDGPTERAVGESLAEGALRSRPVWDDLAAMVGKTISMVR